MHLSRFNIKIMAVILSIFIMAGTIAVSVVALPAQEVLFHAGQPDEQPYVFSHNMPIRDGTIWQFWSFANNVDQNLIHVFDFPDDAESALFTAHISGPYDIQVSTDLQSWTPVSQNMSATSSDYNNFNEVSVDLYPYISSTDNKRIFVKISDIFDLVNYPDKTIVWYTYGKLSFTSAAGAAMDNLDPQKSDYFGFGACTSEDEPYIDSVNAHADSNNWIMETKGGLPGELVYKMALPNTTKTALLFLEMGSTYKLEISKDKTSYDLLETTTIASQSNTSTMHHVVKTYQIAEDYIDDTGCFYVRVTDSTPADGAGARVYAGGALKLTSRPAPIPEKAISFNAGTADERPYIFTWSAPFRTDLGNMWYLQTYHNSADRNIIYMLDFPDDTAEASFTADVSGNYRIKISTDMVDWVDAASYAAGDYSSRVEKLILDSYLVNNPSKKVFIRFSDTYTLTSGSQFYARLKGGSIKYKSPSEAPMDNLSPENDAMGFRACVPAKVDAFDDCFTVNNTNESDYIVDSVGIINDGNLNLIVEKTDEPDKGGRLVYRLKVRAGAKKAMLYISLASTYKLEVSKDGQSFDTLAVGQNQSNAETLAAKELVLGIDTAYINADGTYYIRLSDATPNDGYGARIFALATMAMPDDYPAQQPPPPSITKTADFSAGYASEVPYIFTWSTNFRKDLAAWALQTYHNSADKNMIYILDFPDDADRASLTLTVSGHYEIKASTDLLNWTTEGTGSNEDIGQYHNVTVGLANYLNGNPQKRVFIRVSDRCASTGGEKVLALLKGGVITYDSPSLSSMDNLKADGSYTGFRMGTPNSYYNDPSDDCDVVRAFSEQNHFLNPPNAINEANGCWIVENTNGKPGEVTYKMKLTPGTQDATLYMSLASSYMIEVSKDGGEWEELDSDLRQSNDAGFHRYEKVYGIAPKFIAADGSFCVRVTDSTPGDGWGARIYAAGAVAMKGPAGSGKVDPYADYQQLKIKAGTPDEVPYIFTWSNFWWSPATCWNVDSPRSFVYVLDFPNDTVTARFTADIWSEYRIEASADLVNWKELAKYSDPNVVGVGRASFKTEDLDLSDFLKDNKDKAVFIRVTDGDYADQGNGAQWSGIKILYKSPSGAAMDNLKSRDSYFQGCRVQAPNCQFDISDFKQNKDCPIYKYFDESQYIFDKEALENVFKDSGESYVIDGRFTMIYKFKLPANVTRGVFYTDIQSTYKIEISKDGSSGWKTAAIDTMHKGPANASNVAVSIQRELMADDGSVYIRISDATPSDGWGAQYYCVGMAGLTYGTGDPLPDLGSVEFDMTLPPPLKKTNNIFSITLKDEQDKSWIDITVDNIIIKTSKKYTVADIIQRLEIGTYTARSFTLDGVQIKDVYSAPITDWSRIELNMVGVLVSMYQIQVVSDAGTAETNTPGGTAAQSYLVFIIIGAGSLLLLGGGAAIFLIIRKKE